MTVILALRCAEGIVLATDSQATAQLAGGVPVKLEAIKLQQLGDSIIWAGTGAQGCSQRVEASLQGIAAQPVANMPRQALGAQIHQLANMVQQRSAQAFVNYGMGAQPESWGGILCGRSSDGPWIMEMDLNGGWQFHDEVASTGSGYALAFHAVASVKHYNVPELGLQAAKAIAYRAIETTCLVSAYGVGLPVQMGVVLDEGAHMLEEDEMGELEELVNLWKTKEVETLGATLGGTSPTGGGLSPEPPDSPPPGLTPPEGPMESSQVAEPAGEARGDKPIGDTSAPAEGSDNSE